MVLVGEGEWVAVYVLLRVFVWGSVPLSLGLGGDCVGVGVKL